MGSLTFHRRIPSVRGHHPKCPNAFYIHRDQKRKLHSIALMTCKILSSPSLLHFASWPKGLRKIRGSFAASASCTCHRYHFDIVAALAREQVDRIEGIQDRDQERLGPHAVRMDVDRERVEMRQCTRSGFGMRKVLAAKILFFDFVASQFFRKAFLSSSCFPDWLDKYSLQISSVNRWLGFPHWYLMNLWRVSNDLCESTHLTAPKPSCLFLLVLLFLVLVLVLLVLLLLLLVLVVVVVVVVRWASWNFVSAENRLQSSEASSRIILEDQTLGTLRGIGNGTFPIRMESEWNHIDSLPWESESMATVSWIQKAQGWF